MCCAKKEKMKPIATLRNQLGEGKMIGETNQERYKYLGILEREDVCWLDVNCLGMKF